MGGKTSKEKIIPPTSSFVIRCSVRGNLSAGKSSLVHRYINGSFEENSLPHTERIEYKVKNDVRIGEKAIELAILDKNAPNP